ncbi:MAG TPA: methyltransferase type 11 [Lentisphaeria bacterium]|nr:MAG: methyltransferase type 11 [Lentisphaerae bacterium GWF2_49_21]HBC85907.1 methyltransferase type 11 [Lentisphaeria bacterium]
MSKEQFEETKSFWNRAARDWDIQVGNEGDSNRILNSDPVLWSFAGDVNGLAVLDAGCGTGYLSRKLHKRGAKVIGTDFSEKMIGIARAKAPFIDFRIDSCSDLQTVGDSSVDMVIANYVLMDTPDLGGTMRAFNRVLKADGVVIVVFSHPCFPQGHASPSADGDGIEYRWSFPYFEQQKCIEPPWGHFTTDFIYFHRPLSDYWKAFKAAGFIVVDFEEPRITKERHRLAENVRRLKNSKNRPYSVAFKLQKNRILPDVDLKV